MIIIKKIHILLSLLVCFFSFVITSKADVITKQIIIDAGHGGTDGGAYVNNILEADLNLEIAYVIKEIFEENGYIVDMTRINKDSLCDSEFIKKEDMNKRINLINSKNYLCFISIHQNTYVNPIYKGSQIFYSAINSNSKILAENIQNSIIINLNNTRRSPIKRDNIYLLNKALPPGVIVECGFLTNLEESKLLQNYEYQKLLGYSIFYGVEKTFK